MLVELAISDFYILFKSYGPTNLPLAVNFTVYPEVLFLLNNGVKRTFYDCVPLVLGTKLANGEQ